MCQVAGLDNADSEKIDSLVERRKQIANGGELVQAGDNFDKLYAVKSGMFKAVTEFDDGRSQVVEFFLPGELIGLDAIYDQVHLYKVVALEDSSVCELDFYAMQEMESECGRFQDKLLDALVAKTRHSQYQPLLMGSQNADQRLAVFLVGISSRFNARGLSGEEYRLSMRRMDIADYLGLALETVGRVFKRFEQKGLLACRGRNTQIIDFQGLMQIAGLMGLASNNL
ncbi:MAG: cyclic nucleotide-binding domain-containing protein [Gammaproteobacteria bacterium]|nr:cyclic nucleotide-binding domain-containing protein [Gammaproteobacteria bacterium]